MPEVVASAGSSSAPASSTAFGLTADMRQAALASIGDDVAAVSGDSCAAPPSRKQQLRTEVQQLLAERDMVLERLAHGRRELDMQEARFQVELARIRAMAAIEQKEAAQAHMIKATTTLATHNKKMQVQAGTCGARMGDQARAAQEQL